MRTKKLQRLGNGWLFLFNLLFYISNQKRAITLASLVYLIGLPQTLHAQPHSAESNVITVDTLAPILSEVKITSSSPVDSAQTDVAKAGDTVILTITSDIDIVQPVVTWTVGGVAASDNTVTYDDVGDGNGATWKASIELGEADTDGLIGYSIGFESTAGNAGLSVTSTTDGSQVVFDKTAPSSFVTGTVSSTGGTVVAGVWNNQNSGLNVTVPIPDDSTLIGGKMQIQGKAGSGSWENIGSSVIISSVGEDKTVPLEGDAFEALNGFVGGESVEIRATLIDTAGNITAGTSSAIQVLISESGQPHSAESEVITVDTLAPILSEVKITSSSPVDSAQTDVAKAGDTVILTITSDIDIVQPVVTWTVGGVAASDNTVTYDDVGDGNGATWKASIELGEADTDGLIGYSIGFESTAGNAGLSVTSTTDGSQVVFDKTAPSSFVTGTVSSTGGTVVAGVWNNQNSGLNVTVPIPDDSTLIGGKMQIQGKAGSGSWENIGSSVIISSVGEDKTVPLEGDAFEALNGFVGGESVEIRATLIDTAGNITAGTSSTTQVLISESGQSHSAESNVVEVNTLSQLAATQIAISTQPTEGPGADVFPIVPVISFNDSFGVRTDLSATVTASIKSGTGNSNAALIGTTSVSAVSGVAEFTDLGIDLAGTDYVLTFESSGFASVDSAAFDVTDPLPYQILFLEEPSGGFNKNYPSVANKVRIADKQGVTVAGATNEITLSIKSGTGTAGAALSGTTVVTASGGLATFNQVAVDSGGANYQLMASSSGLNSATTSTFNIVAPTTTSGGGYPSNTAATITTINAPLSALNADGTIGITSTSRFPDTTPTLITPEQAPRGADPGRFAPGHEPVATDQSLTTPPDTSLNISLDVTDPKQLGLTLAITDFPDHGRIDSLIYKAVSDHSEAYFPLGIEFGDEITLGTGGRRLTDFQFEVWSLFQSSDTPKVVFKIYKNDGASIQGLLPSGTTAKSDQKYPGTVIFESDAVSLSGGFQTVDIQDIDIDVPDKFTWVVKFTGMTGMSDSRAGLLIAADPVTGESYGDFWEKLNGEWLLYQVSSDPSLESHFSAVVHGYDNTSTSLTYVPDSGYTGTDSFSYKVTDWYNFSDTAAVTLQINAAQGGNNSGGLFARPNPVSPLARPILFEFAGEPFAFSLFTEEGKNYRVESSPDMIEWYAAKSIRGTGQKVRFIESRGFLPQEQFYRVRIQE